MVAISIYCKTVIFFAIELFQLTRLCGPIELMRIVKHLEYWSPLKYTELKVDHSWRRILRAHNVIGHRLGSYEDQNQLSSAVVSLKKGVKFLEVDLWQLDDGTLLCHHGPELPSPQKYNDSNSCTLGRLINLLSNSQEVYLIVDIKTDYLRALFRIHEIMKGPHGKYAQKTIIFQAYSPADLRSLIMVFGNKPGKINSPIVTLYNAFSNPGLVAQNLPSWVGGLTVPTNRIPDSASVKTIYKGYLLTHPVSNCIELKKYRSLGIVGFYGPHTLIDCEVISSRKRI